MRVRKESSSTRILQLLPLLFLYSYKSHCHPLHSAESYAAGTEDSISPDTSPDVEPEPFLPLLAPSPLMPFRNYSVPTLSGQCTLNFSSVQTAMSKTAINCYSFLAPFLNNAICCPQFRATMVILIGQSSKYSGLLALEDAQAKTCLSDFENTLHGQGTDEDLGNLCSIHPANLTEGSCPIAHVNEFESIVESTRLLAACRKIDPVSECCEQVCENAILDAAKKIALKGSLASDGTRDSEKLSTKIEDCKNIVLRWLAGKLDPFSANGVLRALISCDINKVCPLDLPEVTGVSKECGDVISNNTSCCIAMGFYMSYLQDLSLLTNLQAVNCAVSLGKKLQKANVTQNVYNLCHIKLMDFTLQGLNWFIVRNSQVYTPPVLFSKATDLVQLFLIYVYADGIISRNPPVESQVSGCLLPSLPSDATYDNSSGLGFTCDFNDNVEAPWPFNSSTQASSCHESTKIPALPTTTTSAQDGLQAKRLMPTLLLVSLILSTLICS